jgi:hypothetical protein
VVWITAVGAFAGVAVVLAGAFFAGVAELLAVWPAAARFKHSRIKAQAMPPRHAVFARFGVWKRITILFSLASVTNY